MTRLWFDHILWIEYVTNKRYTEPINMSNMLEKVD